MSEENKALGNEQATTDFDNGEQSNIEMLSGLVGESEETSGQAEQPPAEEDATPKVTEEMAEQYPEMKSLIGKPITEVAKTYSELRKKLTETTQELSEIKKQTEVEETEDDDELPVIDPLEDPEGFAEWQRKTKEKIVAEAEKRAIEAVNRIKREQAMQAEIEKQQAEYLKRLKQALPEGIDAELAVKSFAETIKKDGKVPKETVEYFSANPDEYIKQISEFAKTLSEKDKMRNAEINNSKNASADNPTAIQTPVQNDIAAELVNLNYNPEDWQ